MSNDKIKKLYAKVTDFFKENGIPAKIVEDKEEERKEEFIKLEAFAKETNKEAEKFLDVVMADGSMAVIEPDVSVGSAIVIMDSEGNPVAAPAGEYELEDGRVLVVVEAGVIDEIRESLEEEIEEDDTDQDLAKHPVDKDKDEPQKVKRLIESIVKEKIFVKAEDFNTIVAELKTENETVKFLKEDNTAMVEKYSDLEDKFIKLQDFMKETLETLLDEPSKEPTVKNKNPLAKEVKKNIFHQPYKK